MRKITKQSTSCLTYPPRGFYIGMILSFFAFTHLNAQSTMLIPAGSVGTTLANSEIQCAAGSDVRSFDFVSNGSIQGCPVAGLTSDIYSGEATATNGANSMSLSWEFEPSGPGGFIVNTSSGIRTNTFVGETSAMTISFEQTMTNPVIDFTGLQASSTIELFDCSGAPLSPILVASTSSHSLSGNTLTQTSGSTGASASLQLPGDVDCFYYITTYGFGTGNSSGGEGVTLEIRTCMPSTAIPPCDDCGPETTYRYLNLFNSSGTGTGATAEVGLDGVKVGDATVVFSNLTVSEDLSGTAFGAFARGCTSEETFILRVDLCEAITVQQLDVLGLETESEVWIGTSLNGTGQSATPAGLNLTQCGGPAHMATTGTNMVTNTNASCRNQGNGNYTVGGVSVSTLFFKYNNPNGGCNFDKATFRVGACVADSAPAVPMCPLTRITVTTDPEVGNGTVPQTTANTDIHIRDANGNIYPTNLSCSEVFTAVENGTALNVADLSPCIEIIDEVDCTECTPTPPCTDCPANTTYNYINLSGYDNATGMGDVRVDGVVVGRSELIFSDLDVSTDFSGTRFGAFDNDGGTFLMKLDFCQPMAINDLDILGLETESQTWIGMSLNGTGQAGIPTGLTIQKCAGDSDMTLAGGNMVTNNHPSCRNQGDASFNVNQTVSTLYFRYHNPVGGCTYDKATFRLGVCTPDLGEVVPECQLTLVDEVVTLANGTTETNRLLKDAFGNYYDVNSCPTTLPTMPVQAYRFSPCAVENVIEECPICIQPGLAKAISNVAPAASGIAGNVDVTFKFTLANYGTGPMINLIINDDINALAGFVEISGAPTVTMVSPGGTAPVPNNAYAGSGNLLNGTSGSLQDGQQIMVEVVAEFNASELSGSATNSAQGGGTPSTGESFPLDDSVSGTNPDPNGDNDPEESSATAVLVPNINLTKDYVSIEQAASGISGNVDITINYVVENTGNVNLSNIDLVDDLNAAFGATFVGIISNTSIIASSANNDPTINAGYTGVGNNNMFTGNTGLLAPGQSVTVSITLELDPNAAGAPDPIFNQASTAGDGQGPFGNVVTVTDLSDSGTNPDSNNGGQPGDTGGHNDPTPIPLPTFNVAKHIAGVACAASETAGYFNVIYQVVVENTGNVPLSAFNLLDNMTYGNALVSVVEVPNVIPVGAYGTVTTATTPPIGNAGFAGNGDNLVNGNGNVLPGELFIIQYTLELNTAQLSLMETNQIAGSASGLGPNGTDIVITDLSDSGYIPESTNSDRPGDTGSHDDPTPLTDCWTDVSNGLGCNDEINLSLDGEFCMASIGADDIIENYHDDCGGATLFPLGGYYQVEITDTNGNVLTDLDPSTPNTIEIDLTTVNTTLTASVSEVIFKNSCWGLINVEDKLIPDLVCTDATVTCADDIVPGASGIDFPVDNSVMITHSGILGTYILDGFDPCGPATLTYSDITSGDQCGSTVIRTWVVVDGSGNSDTCTSTITIVPVTISDVNFPINTEIDCAYNENDVYQNTDLTNTHTFTTDANLVGKLVTGEPDAIDGCGNIQISSNDLIVDICEGSYQVLRTWTAIDWCAAAPNNQATTTQIIKVLDTTGPSIAPIANINLSTSSNACEGTAILPIPSVTDDCSGNDITFEYTSTSGSISYNNGLWSISDLELGTHNVTVTATDGCGNGSSTSFTITSGDQIAPVAICDEYTVASIGSEGFVSIPAFTFDDGSYDNCEIVEYQVRRMTDACNVPPQLGFGDYALFCCADIGTNVMVELRVKDAAGNTNSCMVEVEVQDKLAPTVICPPNKTIACTDDYTDLGLTGEAIATDNCDEVTPTFIDNANISSCGEGTVTRIWSVIDASGNSSSCVQFITIENSNPFNIVDTECRTFPVNNVQPAVGPHSSQDDVEWPCDISLNTCGLGLSPDDLEANYPLDARPQVADAACGSVGVTYEDQELLIQGDACLKLLRNWIIIDWCQYDENNPSAGGRWEYVQIIEVLNSQAPTVNCGNSDSYVQNFEDNCGSTYVNLFIDANDDCTPQADLTYYFEVENGSGTVIKTGTINNASDAFNNGSYKITWTVSDGCGNQQVCEHSFEVVDAKKPTPVCLNGLATVIMPSSGMVEIWAVDFESGSSFDNCTPHSALEFSFSSDINDKSKVFTCADIANSSTIPVEIWVTDGAGNQDFCLTYILIQDSNGACPPGPTATVTPTGTISTEEGEEVEDANVYLDGSNTAPIITGANGVFNFGQMPITTGTNYLTRPEKNVNPLNGVTTFDLVLISKHILGIDLLGSPYKVIAADANNSGSVTTFDIVTLRRLILQIDQEFQGTQTSWRFVDGNHTFADPLSPFPFPETIDIMALPQGAAADFVGVKIGDVNGSASPNQLLGTDTRNIDGNLIFNIENKEVKAGEEFTIEFTSKDFNDILGYQFTLGFDVTKVEFVDQASSFESIDDANFGLNQLNEGLITTSWNNSKGVSLDENEVVFSLTFTASATTTLDQIFELNSRITEAEAYSNENLLNVLLDFGSETSANRFELYQNTPNPFKDVTTIGFNLPQAATATLNIFDVDGKTLQSIEMDGVKGYNQVEVNLHSINAVGVLYYQVKTSNNTATQKMIILE